MRRAKQWVCVLVLAAFFVAMPKGYAEPRDSWSLEARVPGSVTVQHCQPGTPLVDHGAGSAGGRGNPPCPFRGRS